VSFSTTRTLLARVTQVELPAMSEDIISPSGYSWRSTLIPEFEIKTAGNRPDDTRPFAVAKTPKSNERENRNSTTPPRALYASF